MERLVALREIYFKGKRYIPGEEIPSDNVEMADAWKRARSVKVLCDDNLYSVNDRDDSKSQELSNDQSGHENENSQNGESEETIPEKKPQKAKMVAAQAGIPVEGECQENLVGKVPVTEARKKK